MHAKATSDVAKPKLVWDRWNVRHIKKHHVTQIEVEEAYAQSQLSIPGHTNRTLFYGKTRRGRHLTIVTSTKNQRQPYIVTTRDMNNKERRKYEKIHSAKTN